MLKYVQRFGLIVMAIVAGMSISPTIGVAAPQALALVATHGGTVLICEDGVCSAEFSAFCLQQDRSSPPQGTAYRLQDANAVKVTGVTEDGVPLTLDPKPFLKFRSLRTHVAVRISVDSAALAARRLRTVSVEVGENVTLAPVAVVGDANPQDAAGLVVAAGPLRTVGSRIVDSNANRMDAARLTSRLINDIDANGRPQTNVTATLWQRAVGPDIQTSATAQGMARGALNLCQFAVEVRGIANIKGCLQQHHDKFVDYLNANYWKAVGAGT
jgi:hypothetical protein